MLDLKITLENDKVILEGLDHLAAELPHAVQRGLERSARGIYDEAMHWLSGAGGQTRSYSREWSAGGEVRKKKKYGAAPGGYPVPIRTKHLIGELNWLGPGQTKSGDVGTFTAGEDEAVIFDSAFYAPFVFLGKGSSAKYGPRNAIKDAFDLFNHGGNIQRLISEEIRKELNQK